MLNKIFFILRLSHVLIREGGLFVKIDTAFSREFFLGHFCSFRFHKSVTIEYDRRNTTMI